MIRFKALFIVIVCYYIIGKALGLDFTRLFTTLIVKFCKTIDELHDIYSMLEEKDNYGNTADSSADIDD